MTTQERNTREPWIRETVKELRKNGSWTGRIHIHKHLYITQMLTNSNPPFRFVLHDYGPYSFELDLDIGYAEVYGDLVAEYTNPGYGPKYRVASDDQGSSGLPENDVKNIRRVAEALGGRNSTQLELIATCLWVKHNDGLSGDEQVVKRVLEYKPKYSGREQEIRNAMRDASEIQNSLTTPESGR